MISRNRKDKITVKNERGNVLVTVILLMAFLVGIGTTAIMQTSTDLNISSNYRLSEEAFYAAEAGIEEARARLRAPKTHVNHAGDPATTFDKWWSAYILSSADVQLADDDPQYSSLYKNYIPTTSSHTNTTLTANSLQSDIPYYVKIRHKLEHDAEDMGHTLAKPMYYDGDASTGTNPATSPGNIIYHGYGDPSQPTKAVQFTTSGATEFKPVEIITSYGIVGNSMKIVEAEVVRGIAPLILAAIYAKGDVTGNGDSAIIDGNDNCGESSALPSIYTKSPAVTVLNGTPATLPDPPGPVDGSIDIPLQDYVDGLKDSANNIITEDIITSTTIGSSTNYLTSYSDTSNPFNVGGLKLTNTTGYGTLLVDGDMTFGGNFTWYGLIICTGTLTFNGGGGGINIRGAVLADRTVDMNGGIDVKYDSCHIREATAAHSARIITWREIIR